MAKITRDGRSGKFMVVSDKKKGSDASIANTVTGKSFKLKGYGAFKDTYVVRKGVDVTKPIADQWATKSETKPRRSKG